MAQRGYILTICTANICRSPMAEALLHHALRAQDEPLKSIQVLSAGVAARVGETVSENSVYALKKVGLDISRHTSQPLTQKLVDEALAVFCMTESHRSMIALTFDPPPKNLYLFREFMGGDTDPEIPDPFGGPLKFYEACRDEMVEAVPSIIERLKALTAQPA